MIFEQKMIPIKKMNRDCYGFQIDAPIELHSYWNPVWISLEEKDVCEKCKIFIENCEQGDVEKITTFLNNNDDKRNEIELVGIGFIHACAQNQIGVVQYLTNHFDLSLCSCLALKASIQPGHLELENFLVQSFPSARKNHCMFRKANAKYAEKHEQNKIRENWTERLFQIMKTSSQIFSSSS